MYRFREVLLIAIGKLLHPLTMCLVCRNGKNSWPCSIHPTWGFLPRRGRMRGGGGVVCMSSTALGVCVFCLCISYLYLIFFNTYYTFSFSLNTPIVVPSFFFYFSSRVLPQPDSRLPCACHSHPKRGRGTHDPTLSHSIVILTHLLTYLKRDFCVQ